MIESRQATKNLFSYGTFSGSPSDAVKGTVFKITPQELQNADAYEVDDYRRVAVKLTSGIRAWVYVDARSTAATL